MRQNEGIRIDFYLQQFAAASILDPISVVLNCTFGDIRQDVISDPAMGASLQKDTGRDSCLRKEFYSKY